MTIEGNDRKRAGSIDAHWAARLARLLRQSIVKAFVKRFPSASTFLNITHGREYVYLLAYN